MEKLIWSPTYSVGVAEIDRQHQYMFRLIDSLAKIENPRVRSEEMADAIDGMVKYASEHFKTEEDLLEAHEFPGLEKHVDQHLVFLERAAELGIDIMDSKEDTPENTLIFLRLWWHHHILNVDMEYRDFLKERGVE